MSIWSKIGKVASIAAPIIAAPFTGGATLALIGAGAGAAGGALGGGGLKGALTGGALGAIPGVGAGGGLAKGAVAPGLKAGLGQAAKGAALKFGTGAGLSLAGKAAGGGATGGNMAGTTGAGVVGDQPGGFWDKWGPLITTGGAAAGGVLAAKAAQKSAQKRSPEEAQALGGAQGVAGQTAAAGRSLLGESRPYITQPANYYQALLHGNRAAMTQAVAPGIASATDVYRGAERSLDKSGVRGAARDVASGELARQRAGQIASLTTGVQPAAAGALAGLGQNLMGQAGGLYSTGGSIYQNLLGQGFLNRRNAMEEGGKTGAAIGGFIRDIGNAIPSSRNRPAPYGLPPGAPTVPPAGTPKYY